MGDKKWAVSGSTPDWQDVEAALRAVASMHSATTMVTILPLGIGSTGGLRIAISSHWEQPDGSTGLGEVITHRDWFGHGNDQLPAFVLGGIYSHDFAVGAAYQQRHLTE